MEKNDFVTNNVRGTQIKAFVLHNLSGLAYIVFTLVGMWGILKAEDIPQWVTLFNGTLFSVCGLVAFLMLSRISANVATRNAVKYAGICWFVASVLSDVFHFYNFGIDVASPLYSYINSLLYIFKTGSYLYLFGCIVRNNPDCRKAKWAINVFFILGFVGTYVISVLSIPVFKSYVLANVVDFVNQFVCFACTYVLFTSDVFNGQTSDEPAPKGAYRFWNKYFTWYVVTLFGTVFLLIALFE